MPCLPARPSVTSGDSAGSTPMTRMAGLAALSARPTPETVPPVPKDATKRSTRPSVSRRISRAVVASWMAGLAGFSNWRGINAPGCAAAISPAFLTAPAIPRRRLSKNKLGAERGEQHPAFGAHGFRHGQHKPVSARSADKRQPNTGIAGGRLDNKRRVKARRAFQRRQSLQKRRGP